MLILRSLVMFAALGLSATAVLSQPDAPGGGRAGPSAAGWPAGRATMGPQVAPPAPSGGPVRVTTDTPEFCDTLAQQVARAEQARPNAPRQAEELAEEGHQMCTTGLIRGGLVRLRRALLMLVPDQ
jgi:hypothetical protein